MAQGFAAVLLNVIGYIPSASSEITTQADGVQKKIWIIFSLIPAVIGMLSVIPLAFYNIVDKERNNMFEELKESRKNII